MSSAAPIPVTPKAAKAVVKESGRWKPNPYRICSALIRYGVHWRAITAAIVPSVNITTITVETFSTGP
jgi:hypothetical protein